MPLRDSCYKEPQEQQERPGRPGTKPAQPARRTTTYATSLSATSLSAANSTPAGADAAAAAAPCAAGIAPDLTSPCRANVLLEVGFWADPRDAGDERPDPKRLVDEEWGGTVAALAVVLYVRSGFLESFELGYSFCRFGCCGEDSSAASTGGKHAECGSCLIPARGAALESRGSKHNKFMGCTTLTDGKYVWPEGLAHYIKEHAVRPPEDFVNYSLQNLQALREAQAGGRLRWNVDERGRGQPVGLSPGTAVFLRDNTTLGIALPPEPEIGEGQSSDGCDGGLCSCLLKLQA